MKSLFLLIIISISVITATAQTPEKLNTGKAIILPVLPKAIGNYTSIVRSGNLIYLSGKGPLQPNGNYVTGKLGKDLNAEQGYAAARLCGIAQIAVLKAELKDLSKIKRIVKVTGYVNGTESFTDQHNVLNGFSDLMVELFGNKGIHARSAVGVTGLPTGWPVEVEMIVEIKD